MRVVVDVERCAAHAQCENTAPEVFRLDENAFVEVLMENPPESLREKVAEAARRCPEDVIRVED